MQQPEDRAMPSPFRWGILGTGAISFKFAHAVHHIGSRVTAIASRGGDGAGALRRQTGGQWLAGYDTAIDGMRDLIDAAYIATPPAFHAQHAIACLEAGIPVLVEKPFAASLREAAAVRDAARANGVFAMEAMWTRFLPAMARLRALLDAGAIGQPRMITGSFGQSYDADAGLGHFDAARGGGALAHLGCYPLSLGQWLFGDAARVQALVQTGGRSEAAGVDEDVAVQVHYANAVIGSFQASIRSPAANGLAVHGTHGVLQIEGPIYRPWGVRLVPTRPVSGGGGLPDARALKKESYVWQRLGRWRRLLSGKERAIRAPYAGNGYHYQVEEVERLVRAGGRESAIMPLDQSVALAALLEQVRMEA
jgi:predicted dehydrogenase